MCNNLLHVNSSKGFMQPLKIYNGEKVYHDYDIMSNVIKLNSTQCCDDLV
jgi:hypothetical protein